MKTQQDSSMLRARYCLTPGGYRRLRARIDSARSEYLQVCQSNEEAAGAGDSSVWHDNFAYEENQRQMHQLARRVRDLEELAASAEVVPLPAVLPDAVRLGTVAVLVFDDDEREERLFLAGFDDGDPAVGRVAYNSPLGRRLLGAEEGDRLELRSKGVRRVAELAEILLDPGRDRSQP